MIGFASKLQLYVRTAIETEVKVTNDMEIIQIIIIKNSGLLLLNGK
jgi:hypothetical protein